VLIGEQIFVEQNDHVETPKQLPKKTMFFFAHVANNWDAEFYAKVNDDVYVNIGEYIFTSCSPAM